MHRRHVVRLVWPLAWGSKVNRRTGGHVTRSVNHVAWSERSIVQVFRLCYHWWLPLDRSILRPHQRGSVEAHVPLHRWSWRHCHWTRVIRGKIRNAVWLWRFVAHTEGLL